MTLSTRHVLLNALIPLFLQSILTQRHVRCPRSDCYTRGHYSVEYAKLVVLADALKVASEDCIKKEKGKIKDVSRTLKRKSEGEVMKK